MLSVSFVLFCSKSIHQNSTEGNEGNEVRVGERTAEAETVSETETAAPPRRVECAEDDPAADATSTFSVHKRSRSRSSLGAGMQIGIGVRIRMSEIGLAGGFGMRQRAFFQRLAPRRSGG